MTISSSARRQLDDMDEGSALYKVAIDSGSSVLNQYTGTYHGLRRDGRKWSLRLTTPEGKKLDIPVCQVKEIRRCSFG